MPWARRSRPSGSSTSRGIGSSTSSAARSSTRSAAPTSCKWSGSGRPGELGCRDPRLPLVLDPEGVDLRARGLRGVELRGGRVEHADETNGLARLDAERDDVLDLEVDGVADLEAMSQAFLHHLEWRPLDAQHLADQR